MPVATHAIIMALTFLWVQRNKMSGAKKTILVTFSKDLFSPGLLRSRPDVVVADKSFKKDIEDFGARFVDLETLVDVGSVHEASALLEELPKLSLPGGRNMAQSFVYQGYELWWLHYGHLFHFFCFPYTQYRRLLAYLADFQKVVFHRPPYQGLFYAYLRAPKREINTIPGGQAFRISRFLPFGVFAQTIITLVCLPALLFQRKSTMIFIGDKFEKGYDRDFRTKFIYEGLREKKIAFVEVVRSLESWKTVIAHAIKRRRPVIYSEAIAFLGRFLSLISRDRALAVKEFGPHNFISVTDPSARFKLLMATEYLSGIYDDIWAIRIMKWLLRAIGVRVAIIELASYRSFHAVFGCKLNSIPTVGILHGVSSRYSTPDDYLIGFSGKKMLSVDEYGVWSEWWKEYYIKNSQAYKPEQLRVSGPMRPLIIKRPPAVNPNPRNGTQVKVLFVAEQKASPLEVIPYLDILLRAPDIELTLKFRTFHDGFEDWLRTNKPEMLKRKSLKITKGDMESAVAQADVVVGCHSTGVLEALLQLRIPIFFFTRRWGDYYGMRTLEETRCFFAESPTELVKRVRNYRDVPRGLLAKLCEQYFGDPYKNGSVWVVERVEQLLKT